MDATGDATTGSIGAKIMLRCVPNDCFYETAPQRQRGQGKSVQGR